MSLKIRPLAALYPLPIYLTDTKGRDAIGMSIPPPGTTERGDRERMSRSQPHKAIFYMGGGGYTAARGLI